MVAPPPSSAKPAARHAVSHALLALVMLALVGLLASASSAFAGQASSGELLFYPCSSCHPVTLSAHGKPTKALPGAFSGHAIVLEGHDKLGRGRAACTVCHDDAAEDPGKLKLADGALIDVTGKTAEVCYRCHSAKYKEFMTGAHGKHKESCVASGCHDPHTPGYIFAPGLPPFTGSGFQFKVLSERAAFSPLAPPAADVPVTTPAWYMAFLVLGVGVAGAGITGLITGKVKR